MKLLAPLIMIAAVLLAAVYWDHTPADADLVFINRGDVFTLDPQRMSYMQDFRMAYALYEGLVRWNNDDMTIEPAAADLPQVSEDGLTCTFTIRPNAKWSNGDPVTAHDFVYSWKRLLYPDTAADYSNLLFVIDGAEEFFRWRNEQLAGFAATITRENAPAAQADRALIAERCFAEAEERFAQTVGLRALDDRTLQVKLSRPTPYFLDLLCFAVTCPVHRPCVEGWPEDLMSNPAMRLRGWIGVDEPEWSQRKFIKLNAHTGRIEQKHEWARPGRLVSNGPYVLAQWRYKRDLRLERNPHFHQPELVLNESVLMVSIEDASTAVLAFESGHVHWLGDVGVEYVTDMLEQRRNYEHRYRVEMAELSIKGRSIDEILAALPAPKQGERRNIHAFPTFGTDFYSFNCRPLLANGRPNPFADARVRRAFAMSVDKRSIVETATRLGEPVMHTLIPPGSIVGYASPAGLGLNLPRARAELADAGWIDRDGDGLIEDASGQPFPTIDLLYTTNSSRYKWISLALKAQWEQALGVRIELRGADTKFYKEDLKRGKFMIARGRWYGDYGDPTTFLDINKAGDGNNDRGFADATFDAMLTAAANERDPIKRMQMLSEAERYLMEEQVPLVPLCQLVQLYMYEPGKLRGLTQHPRLVQYLWRVRAQE